MANKVGNVVKPIVDPIVKTFNYVTEKVEGLPTWAKVGIGVIGAAIAITTGVGATYVATTMAKSAIGGAVFGAATYGVESLITGKFDKTEFVNNMLDGAADMFMVSGVMLGTVGLTRAVANRAKSYYNKYGDRIKNYLVDETGCGSADKNKLRKVLTGKDVEIIESGSGPIKEFDIVPYGKFRNYPGDELSGHELLQNA